MPHANHKGTYVQNDAALYEIVERHRASTVAVKLPDQKVAEGIRQLVACCTIHCACTHTHSVLTAIFSRRTWVSRLPP